MRETLVSTTALTFLISSLSANYSIAHYFSKCMLSFFFYLPNVATCTIRVKPFGAGLALQFNRSKISPFPTVMSVTAFCILQLITNETFQAQFLDVSMPKIIQTVQIICNLNKIAAWHISCHRNRKFILTMTSDKQFCMCTPEEAL